MPVFKESPSTFFRYANSTLMTLVALGLSWLTQDVIGNSLFLFFVAAVALSAWYGGLGPGLVSTVLSIVLANLVLMEPQFTLAASYSNVIQFVVFAFVAFLVNWTETNRRQSEEALRRARDELQVILNGVADGISAQDASGQIIFANQAAAQLSGYSSPDDMIHSRIEEVRRKLQMLNEDGQPLALSDFPRERVFREGKSVSLMFRIRFADTGEERWFSQQTSPVFNDKGKVDLVVNIFRNVTEQMTSERERSELAAIVRSSEDAIIGKSLDGLITSWNPGAEQLYGYTREEVMGKPVTMLFPEDIRERDHSFLDRVYRGEQIRSFETMRLRKNGEPMDISLTISPIRDLQDRIVGYSAIERDISQRRRLEQIREEHTRFLRNVLNTLPIIVGVLTPEGVLTEANRTALQTASLAPEDVVGKPFADTYWWSYFEGAQTQLRDAIRRAGEGEIVRYDAILRVDPDRFITLDFSISPMYDADGKLVSLIAAGIDITDRKNREEEILRLTMLSEAQRRRLDLIVSNLPGIVYESILDLDTREPVASYTSQYAEKVLGYPLESWEHPQFLTNIMHPDDAEVVRQDVRAMFEAGEPGVLQFRCIASDGRTVSLEAHATAVIDEAENQVIVCGIMMDITSRKEIEEALAQHTEELRRSNEELEQFAYVASHDLQEPLRMVSSYLQLIEQRYAPKLDDNAKEFIDFAVEGAAHMKDLINDLLIYSRVQRDQEEFSQVSIDQILDQVQRHFQLTIEDTQATITHDPLPQVLANQRQMVQLFQNLIANGLKFKKEEPPVIHIGAQEEKGRWVFSVSDNGIGIDPGYQERIFVLFQRLHPRDRYPGTGIGLAICKKIVEKHGGDIWVESVPGQGSTFYFSVPKKHSRRN